MKRMIQALVVAAAIGTLASMASAQPTPVIHRRHVRQEARIHQGVRSGQLTRGEARRLQAGERHIAMMNRRAHRDGRVTMRERERIARAQNRESRRIFRLKHNRREA
jgi:hypothetical protein